MTQQLTQPEPQEGNNPLSNLTNTVFSAVEDKIDQVTGGKFHDQIEAERGNVEQQVQQQVQAHGEDVLDRAGEAADQATGGKFHDQIQQAKQAADNQLGTQ